jgi:hypothetical protein
MYKVPPPNRHKRWEQRLARIVRVAALLAFLTMPLSCCLLANAALNYLEAGKGCLQEHHAFCARRAEQDGIMLAIAASAIYLLSMILLIGWLRAWHARTLAALELLIVLAVLIPVLLWPSS